MQCIIYTALMAARSSVPHKCLYRASNSAFPQNKPNAIKHISGSGSSLVLVCSCSLHFLSPLGTQGEQLFLFSQFPCPPQGSLYGRSGIQSLLLLQNLPRSLSRTKTKPGGLCNYPVWHLLSSNQPRHLRQGWDPRPSGVTAGGNHSMAELAPRHLNQVQQKQGKAVQGDLLELPWPGEVAHPLITPSPCPQCRTGENPRPLSRA